MTGVWRIIGNIVVGFAELARRAPHVLEEMQEDPRFSSWNPRYRIPKPVYGLSKPFSQRPAPKPVPTYDKYVSLLLVNFDLHILVAVKIFLCLRKQ